MGALIIMTVFTILVWSIFFDDSHDKMIEYCKSVGYEGYDDWHEDACWRDVPSETGIGYDREYSGRISYGDVFT